MKKKDRPITLEEKKLWASVMSDAFVFSSTEKRLNNKLEKKIILNKTQGMVNNENIYTHDQLARAKLKNIKVNETGDSDRRSFLKLKRGQFKIDGRLDLHGKSLEDAYLSLFNFLTQSQYHGFRCVLIITGKGYRNPSGVGRLKSKFPYWLNESPLRNLVLSTTIAQKKHGGEGAFYVLLRKNKSSL